MGKDSAISWTNHTFNPWWGCKRVSPACDHCYAATFATRIGKGTLWTTDEREARSDHYWNDPIRWDRAAAAAGRPAFVFTASMADVFEDVDRPEVIEGRARLWALVASTSHLVWLLLTKRAENVAAMVPTDWIGRPDAFTPSVVYPPRWPSNVWIGTTVENQLQASRRLPHLVGLPAQVVFVSAEPLLGPLDLTPWLADWRTPMTPGVDWVIAGGESGPHHRPLNVDHVRRLRDQCDDAGVPFFFKQWGGVTPAAGGHLLDDVEHHARPVPNLAWMEGPAA